MEKLHKKKEELIKTLEGLSKEFEAAQSELTKIQTKFIAHKGALETIEQLLEDEVASTEDI